MPTLRTIIFALLGLFLAVGYLNMRDSGYFQQWEKLSVPTKEVIEYFSATDKSQYPIGANIKEPCDYSSPAFSLLSNSPKGIIECVKFITLYPEGTSQYIIARDNKSNIWSWSHTYILYFYDVIWFPLIGLSFGATIAVLTKKPAKAQTTESQSINRTLG